MITFEIYNGYTQLRGTPEQIKLIRQWCTLEYEFYGMDWSTRPPRYKKQKGYVTYFTQDNEFPTGWTARYYRIITKKLNMKVKVVDKRRQPSSNPNPLPIKEGFKLRYYQEEAFKNASKVKRGILHHATGSGKTPLAGYMLAKWGLKSIYVVPDRTLLNQAIGDFINDVGIPKKYIGKIGDKVYEPRQITVATIQSLWSLYKQKEPNFMKFISDVDVLFFDESHHIKMDSKGQPKNTYFYLAMAIDAHYRFGLTATPGDPHSIDRRTLEGATGRVLHHVSSSELINEGYLTKPYIWMIRCPADRISDWKTTYDVNIVESEYRNEVISKLAHFFESKGLSVVVSVNLVQKHAEPLHIMIPGSKILTGKSDGRTQALEAFKRKEYHILITTLIKEGVNIPSMDVIINAAGGKSDKKTVQQTGRVLRTNKDKNAAILIDFFDDDEKGILIKHSRKRKRQYELEEEFEFMGIIDLEKHGFDFLKELMEKVNNGN